METKSIYEDQNIWLKSIKTRIYKILKLGINLRNLIKNYNSDNPEFFYKKPSITIKMEYESQIGQKDFLEKCGIADDYSIASIEKKPKDESDTLTPSISIIEELRRLKDLFFTQNSRIQEIEAKLLEINEDHQKIKKKLRKASKNSKTELEEINITEIFSLNDSDFFSKIETKDFKIKDLFENSEEIDIHFSKFVNQTILRSHTLLFYNIG